MLLEKPIELPRLSDTGPINSLYECLLLTFQEMAVITHCTAVHLRTATP